MLRPIRQFLSFDSPFPNGWARGWGGLLAVIALPLAVHAADLKNENSSTSEPAIVVEPETPAPVELPETPEARDRPRIIVEPEETSGGGFRIEISGDSSNDGEARIVIGGRSDGKPQWRRTGDSNDRISFGNDVWVEADEVIEGNVVVINGNANISGGVEGEVIVIGGDVFVEGRVESDVVAILGDIELTSEAYCGGDVVGVGGQVDQNGGVIEGEALSIRLLPWLAGDNPQVRSAALAGIGISFLAFAVFTLLVGGAFRRNAERMVETVESERGRCLWMGFVGHVLANLAVLVLVITIIGAPLAPIVGFLWWCASMVGLTVGAAEAVRRSGSRAIVGPAMLAGAIAHAALFVGVHRLGSGSGVMYVLALVLIVVGMLALTWFSLLGAGALISTRFGGRSRPSAPEAPSPPIFEPHSPVRAS